MEIRIIIAGGRDYNNYLELESICDSVIDNLNLSNEDTIEIVDGKAQGADLLGYKYAMNRKYKSKRFEAKWNLYGKGAGFIRNSEMADYAKHNGILIAFWNNKSKGTAHMIDIARRKGLKVFIYNY